LSVFGGGDSDTTTRVASVRHDRRPDAEMRARRSQGGDVEKGKLPCNGFQREFLYAGASVAKQAASEIRAMSSQPRLGVEAKGRVTQCQNEGCSRTSNNCNRI
jgi:hypothetical protein